MRILSLFKICLCYLIPSIPSHSLRFCGKNRPLIIAASCCPPRSRTSLLGTKIRCNTDIRVDSTFEKACKITTKNSNTQIFLQKNANHSAFLSLLLLFTVFLRTGSLFFGDPAPWIITDVLDGCLACFIAEITFSNMLLSTFVSVCIYVLFERVSLLPNIFSNYEFPLYSNNHALPLLCVALGIL